jgi:hypothetical protein
MESPLPQTLHCQVCVDLMFKEQKAQEDKGIAFKEIVVPVPRIAETMRLVTWNSMPVNQLVCFQHYGYQEPGSSLAIG